MKDKTQASSEDGAPEPATDDTHDVSSAESHGSLTDPGAPVQAEPSEAQVDVAGDTQPDSPARMQVTPRVPSRNGVLAVRWFAFLFVVSVAFAAAGLETKLEALSLVGGYGIAFFGVGGAPFQLAAELDPYARLTGAILVGFSVLLGVGALMADLHGLWHPIPAAVIVGAVAVFLHLAGLWRVRGGQKRADRNQVPLVPSLFRAAWAKPRPAKLSLLATLLGTGMWLAPSLWTHDPNPGFWGMLKTIGPLWYGGLVVLLIGFAIGRRHELCAAVSAVSFGLATTLTPALVYATPRNQTAAKQMELTRFVLLHHHINVTGGIYQAFSSMFGGIAWMAELLHIHGTLGSNSLLGVATYWPVLLVLMRVVELRFLTGRVLATTGRRWCAVMIVLLVDSLGNDYFSPQSIGYVMAIGCLGMAVNGVTQRPFKWRSTLCLLTLTGVVLAPTHELTPYMVAGALFILAIFGQAPWWTVAPIAVPALAWAGVVHKAIGQNFTFSALFNISNFRPPVTVGTPGLERLPVVAIESHALLLSLVMLVGLASLGFVANVRRKWAWAYALCPIVGLGLIAINPYGNEGIFRATLFAIPWMAVLAMKMPQPGRFIAFFARPIVLTVITSSALICLLAAFLVAAYAMDGTNVLPRNDVAVANYVARLPSRNAFVLSIGSADNPADAVAFTANYTPLTWDSVATDPELQEPNPTPLDLLALADKYGLVAEQMYGAGGTSPLYVVWANSVVMYAQAYAQQSPRQLMKWLHLLKTSRDWELVDRSGDTYLFRLRAAGTLL
jgi:hypothetical protein